MKIDKFNSPYINTNIPKTRDDKTIDKVKKENSVNVEISTSTQKLTELIKKSEDPNFSQRVEEIRLSIQKGTYNVSSEKIAEKLIDTIKEQKGGS